MKAGMLLVVSVFLGAYGGLHYYIYRKAVLVLSSGHGFLALLLALLVLAPLLAETMKAVGLFTVAVPLAWIGYTWMGFAFLFFSFSLVLDLLPFFVGVGGRLLGVDGSRTVLSPVLSVLAMAALAVVVTGYGFVSARQIHVEWVRIPAGKPDRMSEPFRIVQISDLHLDVLSDETRVRRMVEVIQSIDPDVVVSTGDLIDLGPDRLAGFADLFRKLNPRFGKFAVTGNHEAYVGRDRSSAMAEISGFQMLSYQKASLDGVIHLVGVDDPAVHRRVTMDGPAEQAVLQRTPKEDFTVLLKHQPRVNEASVPWFDLQLSGHTHGGQIFPFHWLTRLAYPAKTGLSQVGDRTWLYVSRGTGTWGPPIRFLAPPEVTVFELQPEP
jgi:predicted MPP superfamily phosphohydrolase